MMNTAKLLWLIFIHILFQKTIAGHKYQQDQGMAGFTCSAASLDMGLAVSTKECAARCSKVASCLGFFYCKTDRVCLGTPSIIIGSSKGCAAKEETLYFKSTGMIFVASDCYSKTMLVTQLYKD